LTSEKITKEYQYKCVLSYLLYLYSRYIKTNKIEILIKIKERLFDEDSTRLIPFSMINELKITCLKTVWYFRGFCFHFTIIYF
jgi:hypothetical protein